MSDYVYDESNVPRKPKEKSSDTDHEAGVYGNTSTRQTKKRARATKRSGIRADGLLPCKEFESEGSCKFGDSCKFSHLAEGEALSEEARAALQQRRKKKRNAICLTFQDTGECAYGLTCRYKHVESASAETVATRLENDRLIAACLDSKFAQEEQLSKIMALPETLRQKARAIFFKKQRTNKRAYATNLNKNSVYFRRKRLQAHDQRPKISGRRTVAT